KPFDLDAGHVVGLTQARCEAPKPGGSDSDQPDQAGEASGAGGTAIGVETGIADSTETAAEHSRNAAGSQTDSSELVDVRHEATRIVTGAKGIGANRVARHERLTHLAAHLECRGSYRRTEPGDQLRARHRHGRHCGLQ